MAEVNTKQWWISELNAILLGSNFEAIENPTVNEDNVVVVEKGTTRPHHIGIKPKKNGNFGMWAKREYVDALPKELVPDGSKPKGQVLHFVSIDNKVFAMNVAKVLAGDTVSTISDKLTRKTLLLLINRSVINGKLLLGTSNTGISKLMILARWSLWLLKRQTIF